MASQNHIIANQVLELTTGSRQHVHALQQDFSKLYWNELLPLINSVFDEVAGTHEYIRIDRMEIDLGNVCIGNYGQMKDRLRKKLKEELQQQAAEVHHQSAQSRASKENRPSVRTGADAEIDLLITFIETGRLPWWAPAARSLSIVTLTKTLIEKQPQALVNALASSMQRDRCLERVIHQFPNSILTDIIQLLKPGLPEMVAKLHDDLMSLHERMQLLPLSKSGFRLLLWKHAFRLAFSENDTSHSDFSHRGGVSRARAYAFTLLDAIARLHQEATADNKEWIDTVEEAMALQVRSGYSFKSKSIRKIVQDWSRLKTEVVRSPSTDPMPESRDANQLEKPRPLRTNNDSETDAVSVSNAGLVLLWPYLPTFFEGLGFVESKSFVTNDSAKRAALMLQYLMTRETAMPEYDLVLNKLLCGLDVDEPLPATLDVTSSEADECTHLLNVVADRWEALKGTSGEGLRQTFLIRDGILRRHNQVWKLTVARTAVDILLDKLPWNISMIRLPWCKQMLYTEW